jgi:hypothetical protein
VTKLILTILGFFCFIHASVDRHLLTIDELKGKFAQKDYLSKSTTTEGTKNDATNTVTVTRAPNSEIVTLEEVSSLLLNIFNVINHAFHYGHLNFTAEDRKKWDISIKKLITRGNFYRDQLDNGNAMMQLTAQERAIINTVFAFRITAGQKRQFTYIENLANLKRQPVQQMRLAFINIILQLYKDQATQIEKSLEYHCNAVAIPRNADGTYRWNDGDFKRWLNGQFTAAPLAGRPRNYTEDQSVNFFQDLLINEKLHPGYYVFYHGAPYQSIGFQFFNSILAKLLNPTGQAFNPRIHIKRDIGKDTNGSYRVVAHENCAIESVTDVVGYMDATGNGDTREPVAKHLVSSSYSLFNPGNPSVLEYYTGNQVMNADGIMNAFGTTFGALTTDATLLTEDASSGQRYRTVYPKLLTDKFTARYINGHPQRQPYYAPFSTMVQFFIKKERVDTTVYFGGASGMRHRNTQGNSQIREVLDAFLGTQLLSYYQRLNYRNPSVREIENSISLQGKIAVTSEAFMNGIASNEIQLVFHGQSNKEAVILDDLKFCIQEQLREDFLKILDAPTAFTMATPAYQFKTRLAEYFNANYTPRLHNMQDIPPLKTAADIVRENPAITMDALIAQLIDMLKDQPLSVAVKEKLFIEEFFTTGILQLKPRKMTPKLIEDRLKEIFDDPLGKLTTKKLDRLRILEFVISFAEATADEKETHIALLKQVVDVLSNNNTAIPVISRVATDAEKKQEFSMLKAIAHGMLLSNDDRFIHYVINAFNVGPTDKFYKHKMWCLSALDIFMEQYINELNDVCAKLDADLRALPAPNQREYDRVKALETEIAEKEHRIKTPQAGDDRTQLQTQVTRLQKELHQPDLHQKLTRIRLEKQIRQCEILLNSWAQIRLEMPKNFYGKPEYKEAKKKVLEQNMKLRDPGAFRNYAHFVNNELLQ